MTDATRRRLARDAFARTAAYDAAIVTWFDASDPTPDVLPRTLHLALERAQPLRYGENPHQQGARYRALGRTGWWDAMTQHGGKELSYLNLYDTEAAWRLVHRFDDTACVIVKHANPCGVAIGDDVADAYVKANACDPVSAFGGIVAVNRHVTNAMATALAPVFTEVVVAPGYDADALATLAERKNVRVLTATAPAPVPFDVRPIDGGLLVQEPDVGQRRPRRLARRHRGRTGPTSQWRDLVFAWQVCAAVSSNAIVYAKDRAGVRHRRGPAEPARLGADRGRAFSRSRRRRGVRERRLLPVP